MTRILLADDLQILRASLHRAFAAAGETVVGEARDGAQAVELARLLRPDFVVMVRAVVAGEIQPPTVPAAAPAEAPGPTTEPPAAANEPLLSERQAEVLQLIANGRSTKQTARELGITQKTLHNHLHAIYRRLGTQNLTHAVLCAGRLGIIDLG